MGYPKTDKEYVAMLEKAASLNTFYWNKYPYNLGYYHEDGRFSFDCVNLVKAILNGWQPTKKVGYYCNDFSRTGDCTEWNLLAQCEYSTNFKKMNCVAVLYLPGHIGTYIGKEVTKNGHVYNCIECTTAWGGGVLYSFVDSAGRRYNHKGGTQNGRWTHWGKMTKWLTYVKNTSPFKDISSSDTKYKFVKDCYDAGLINGYSDKTFKPNASLTRGDACVILHKLLKKMGLSA